MPWHEKMRGTSVIENAGFVEISSAQFLAGNAMVLQVQR
jgi:hypothetical protein